MRRAASGLAAAAAVTLASPPAALAHLVNSGLGPFYDGALHLAMSPDDLLALLGVSLLAGLRGTGAGRLTTFVLPAAWLGGGLAGLTLEPAADLAWLSVLSFALLGLLVAVDPRIPETAVAGLACLVGGLHGVLNGSALAAIGAGPLSLFGIASTVMVAVLMVSAAVVSLHAPWARVAVRVAGSWVAAVGMLMFGWLFRSGT